MGFPKLYIQLQTSPNWFHDDFFSDLMMTHLTTLTKRSGYWLPVAPAETGYVLPLMTTAPAVLTTVWHLARKIPSGGPRIWAWELTHRVGRATELFLNTQTAGKNCYPPETIHHVTAYRLRVNWRQSSVKIHNPSEKSTKIMHLNLSMAFRRIQELSLTSRPKRITLRFKPQPTRRESAPGRRITPTQCFNAGSGSSRNRTASRLLT